MGSDRAPPPELSPLLLERGASGTERDAGIIEEPQTRFRLFSAAAARIRSQCEQDPLLIVLDDLHAAQQPALLLLEFLAREAADLRLVLVGTYRAEDMLDRPHCAAILESLPVDLHVPLEGLTREDVGAHLESVAAPHAGPEVVSRIHQISGGNPLFLQELLRLYGAKMSADPPALDWIAHATGRLRDAIRRHLRRLSPRARELLATGAVIGSTFELATLRQVLGWSDDDLVECGSQAVAARVIREISPGTFSFCHELIRDRLYHELCPLVRGRLHAPDHRKITERSRSDDPPTA